jgi:outer membrane protein OmpA-like peptidoglycan-associated protein
VTGTSTYLKSTRDVTFTISAAAPPSNNSSGGSSIAQPVPVEPCNLQASAVGQTTTKTKTFSGFAINSAVLTPAMKKQIRTWLKKHPEEVCVSVAGFTMGPRVLSTDPKLAKDRARAVRAYIASIRPEASFTPVTSRTQRLVGDDVRRAKVTLSF